MALARTTTSAAVAVDATAINLTSLTGLTIGDLIVIDQEVFKVTKGYDGTNPVPVLRGQDGTKASAHASGAGAVHGTPDEFANSGAQAVTTYAIAGKVRTLTSYSAAGAITLPTAGTDAVAILNGTSVLAMTVAAPGKDLDGSLLWIASNGAAAHTITFAGGLSGAGSSYDVLTVNATAPVLMGPFMAVNEKWQAPVAVPMSGTVTNITAGVA